MPANMLACSEIVGQRHAVEQTMDKHATVQQKALNATQWVEQHSRHTSIVTMAMDSEDNSEVS